MAPLIQRARRSLAYRGWGRSLRLLRRWIWFHLRHGVRAAAPHAFDLEFGTETAAPAPIGERKGESGVPYGPVDPVAFAALLERIEIGAAAFTFLDFGCGRGRALLLASEYPFRQILGVEHDRGLHAAAERNLALWARHPNPRRRCSHLAAVWEDAAAWEFPIAPTVFFFNEPFYAPVMERTAARIRASLAAYPRPAYVLYLGNWYRPVWEAAGDFELLCTRGDDRIYRWIYRWRQPTLG